MKKRYKFNKFEKTRDKFEKKQDTSFELIELFRHGAQE
jgi:hypothetical protein